MVPFVLVHHYFVLILWDPPSVSQFHDSVKKKTKYGVIDGEEYACSQLFHKNIADNKKLTWAVCSSVSEGKYRLAWLVCGTDFASLLSMSYRNILK